MVSPATDSFEPLDTVVKLVTPERIIIVHPLAGPARRFVAYLLDLMVLIAATVAILFASIILSLGSPSGFGPFLVGLFVLTWGYGAFCEGIFNGQTLGKAIMRIRVVSDRGVPISGAQAIIRNLVASVDGVAFCFQIGLASMVLSRKFQRLGDLAAGTMVVIEERRQRRGVTRVKEPEVTELLPWLPGRIAARSELARVLSDYVEARRRFAPERRAEMAGPLANTFRAQFGLSEKASSDAILCAVYHRVFVGE
jgi:uncharacterized RDD family membrane protein YckC